MSENVTDTNIALTDIVKNQKEILDKIEHKNEKDLWDKLAVILPLISGFLIAGVGGYFTYIYDSNSRAQEARIKDLQEKQLQVEIATKELDHLNRIQPLLEDFLSDQPERRQAAALKLRILLPKDRFEAVARLLQARNEKNRSFKSESRDKLGYGSNLKVERVKNFPPSDVNEPQTRADAQK